MIGNISDATREYINNRTDAVLGDQFNPEQAQTRNGVDPNTLSVGSPFGSINDAIAKRSADKFYDPNQIRELRQLDYIRQRGKTLGRQGDLLQRQYQLDNAAALAMHQRANQEEAQRNAIIGSVLGIGLTVGGAYLGGPVGAAAGAGAARSVQSGNSGGSGYLGANTNLQQGGY